MFYNRLKTHFARLCHISILSVLLIGALGFSNLTWAETVAQKPSGAGTLTDPVRIENLAHLRWLGETTDPADMKKVYRIVNDIDASESATWDNFPKPDGFLPIGNVTTTILAFEGRILGNNKTISNLHVAGGNPTGFILQLAPTGRVESLRLENLKLSGSNRIGGIAAINEGTIANSSVTTTITTTSTGGRIGGLAGVNLGIIARSYAHIEMQAASGTNLEHDDVGGLVGEQGPFADDALITNSYATGAVSGRDDVGGLVGFIDSGEIRNAFAAVDVNKVGSAPGSVGGAIGGGIATDVTLSNVYWSTGFAGISTDTFSETTAVDKANLFGVAASTTLVGFNFNEVWRISTSSAERCVEGLPQLRAFGNQDSAIVQSTLSGGTGTIDDPCLISDWHDLQAMNNHRQAHFALSNNLTSQTNGYATVVNDSSNPFEPIGSQSDPFIGSLDGRQNQIVGLKIDRASTEGIGLFTTLGSGSSVSQLFLSLPQIKGRSSVGALAGSIASNAFVDNVTVSGGSITATESINSARVGGLTGLNQGTIRNTQSSASVVASADEVGGLIGENTGEVSLSSASGDVTGRGQVGGLIGKSQSGSVTQSYATGNVTATGTQSSTPDPFQASGVAGGLIGASWFQDRISEVVATGSVDGDITGGLVGAMASGPLLTDAYSSATLTGNPQKAGGLVGIMSSATLRRAYFIGTDDVSGLDGLVAQADSATTSELYWDSDRQTLDISGTSIGSPLSTQEMITLSTFSNWNFTDTWTLGDGGLFYPYLQNVSIAERPEILLSLSSSTPSDAATDVSLTPSEILLKFNIDTSLSDEFDQIELLRDGQYVGNWTLTRPTGDLSLWRLGAELLPGSTYTVIIPPGAFRAAADTSVGNSTEIRISFTTIPFATGDGTSSSPYAISSVQDWVNLSKNPAVWDKYFVLTQNIRFPTADDQRITLSPITTFSGQISGQNNFVINPYVRNTDNSPTGLIGTLSGGITDLHVINADVQGTQATGILVGRNEGEVLESSASGTVTSTNGPAGGLIGTHLGGVSKSFATATVDAPNVVGGLIGLAGQVTNVPTVTDSYAISTVKFDGGTTTVAGGLVGSSDGDLTITDSYASSSLSITSGSPPSTGIGGVVGASTGTVSANDTFWNGDQWAVDYSVGGTKKTEGQLRDQATFTNWDFASTWEIIDTTDVDGTTPLTSFPHLQALPYDAPGAATRRMPIPELEEAKYASGTGTDQDPFIINNWLHLNNIRDETANNPHFKLGADLNQNTIGYETYASATANTNQGWIPLPAFTHAGFTSFVFDGNGKTIRDLVIDRDSESKVGLFAEIPSGSTVTDVVIQSANVAGQDQVGILAGVNNGTVELSASAGVVTSNYVDPNPNDSVFFDANLGGLVGINNGTIRTSYSTAQVTGLEDGGSVGGLVGLNTGAIEDTYATGEVFGASNIGGLVGTNGATFGGSGSISRSFAVGLVQGGDEFFTGAEGLVGQEVTTGGADDASDISPNSFWDINTSGQTDPGDASPFPSAGVGQSTSAMKSEATYTTDLSATLAWNFTDVWDIVNISTGNDTIVSYPYLRDNPQSPAPGRDYLVDFEPTNPGSGTETDPYRITTWRHLANMARYPDAHFELVNDLVASDSDTFYVEFASGSANDGLGWEPILNQTTSFTGKLEGNGYSISGFVINRPNEDNVGLFGQLDSGAEIQNITISGTITGRSNVGILAGSADAASLSNVVVEDAQVSAGANPNADTLPISNAGGLVGRVINNGTINNVNIKGTVITGDGVRVGGIVGHLIGGQISQSQASTQISASWGVGGLVGRLSTLAGAPSATILESFSITNISVSDCVVRDPEVTDEEGFGGLVGTAASLNAAVEKSYAEISMTFGNQCEQIGGLVGYSNLSKINNSYAIGTIISGHQAKHIGTILGNHVNGSLLTYSYGAVSIQAGDNSEHIGGLIGSALGLPSTDIVASYYNSDLTADETSSCDTSFDRTCGEGKNTLQLKNSDTFSTWALGGTSPIWEMASGDVISYPYLVTPKQTPAPGLEGAPLTLKFDTSLGDGTTISIPMDGTVNVRIDWGDGNTQAVTSDGFAEHTYASEGTYTVKVFGELGHLGQAGGLFKDYNHADKWVEVSSFGNIGIGNLAWAFKDAVNLESVPNAIPTGIQNLRGAFQGASNFNSDISGWDTSNVTDFSRLFYRASSFNQPIGNWETGHAKTLSSMFFGASAFNQPLDGWDVSKVTGFYRMFGYASSFNQDLTGWMTSSAKTMQRMFESASAFNGQIGTWDTSNVTNMTRMFLYAEQFNQPIGTWDVSNVKSFEGMFLGAYAFDQSLNSWRPNNGQSFKKMFQEAYSFNQPLDEWNMSAATDLEDMFYLAESFDQSLASWDFSNVIALDRFVADTALSVQNYEALLNSLSNQTVQPNLTLNAQPLRWRASQVQAARDDLTNQDNWTIQDGGALPTFSGGDGSQASPHLISSLDDLRALSESSSVWNLHFELTQSIDATDTATWNEGFGFSPIGLAYQPFTGHFDGRGNSIMGLTINRPDESRIGLFGELAGTVDSLHLLGADITGFNEVGGLVGHNDGMVLDAIATGEITGSVGVGGLIGTNSPNGFAVSVASHTDTYGDNQVGGLIGVNRGSLQYAYTTGTVTGINSNFATLGGLSGTMYGRSAKIEQAYSASTVTTQANQQLLGGLLGSLGSFDPNSGGGELKNSFFIGDLEEFGTQLTTASDFVLDVSNITPQNLRALSGIGADPEWAINSTSGEWSMISVNEKQEDGKFYRAYPYLKIITYDDPGTNLSTLPLPGLIEMPMPPVIDQDNTSMTGNTLTISFSVPQDSVDARVTGLEYSLDNGQSWQAVTQTTSPIKVSGLTDQGAYTIRVRTQTDQGAGPQSSVYRITTSNSIFQDRFQALPSQ